MSPERVRTRLCLPVGPQNGRLHGGGIARGLSRCHELLANAPVHLCLFNRASCIQLCRFCVASFLSSPASPRWRLRCLLAFPHLVALPLPPLFRPLQARTTLKAPRMTTRRMPPTPLRRTALLSTVRLGAGCCTSLVQGGRRPVSNRMFAACKCALQRRKRKRGKRPRKRAVRGTARAERRRKRRGAVGPSQASPAVQSLRAPLDLLSVVARANRSSARLTNPRRGSLVLAQRRTTAWSSRRNWERTTMPCSR